METPVSERGVEAQKGSEITDTITVEEIIRFILPPGFQHSKSTTRLYILAEHGPLSNIHSYISCFCSTCQKEIVERRKTDEVCKALFRGDHIAGEVLEQEKWICPECKLHCQESTHIQSGGKGKSIVNEITLKEMGAHINRDDVLEAFGRKNKLSYDEQVSFLDKVGQDYKLYPTNYTREEVPALFAEIPKDEQGRMDFYKVREAILKLRWKHTDSLRDMYPKLAHKGIPPPTKTKLKKVQYTTILDEHNLTPEVRQIYGNKVYSRMLSSHSHTAAELFDQNNPEVVQNIALLRSTVKQSTNWNAFF